MLTLYPPARFAPAGKQKVDLAEPSDVVWVPGGTFLIVGDLSDELLVVGSDGTTRRHPLQGVKSHKSGLEAIAYDVDRRRLIVSSEERNQLVRFSFDPASDAAPVVDGKVTVVLGSDENKGIEGMTWLPAAQSPTGRPQLLLANEQSPRLLVLVEPDGTDTPRPVTLPSALEDACRDFAALALDPRTGHVFVASEESATLAEISIAASGSDLTASLLAVTPLLSKKGKPLERAEGITFDGTGDLFVLLENDCEMLRLQRLS